jgi:glucose/arabinose dehydrogenase
MKRYAFALSSTILLMSTCVAFSQSAEELKTLGAMRSTGKMADIPLVPQTGAKADQIKKNLEKIKLPTGFQISLYALVPDARHIAVGPQGVVTFVSTRKTKVWAVTDRGKTGTAEEVKQFAPTLGDISIPDGVCFSRDGFLYVTAQNAVIEFPAAEFFYESPDVVPNPIVKPGELIPKSEESYNHTSRACTVGPDNKLYLTLGQPFNVPPKEKRELYTQWGIGGVVRMDRDGKNREVYARGVRNSVGLGFNPKDKVLWFTDNQVDGMGDTIPPGEINRAPQQGINFGFPWYGGGKIRTADYKDETPPADVVFPQVETDAHAADLGMSFYSGRMFPAQYQGALFSAQHGSWNRTDPVGARVMVTTLKEDGTADKTEVFASGWLTGDGEYLGRPVDVQQLRDGSLLVSDDLAGALYRITYTGK